MTPSRIACAAGLVAVAGSAHAGGIPAVHGLLQHQIMAQLPEGLPQVLSLSVSDRPATFHAHCTIGETVHEATSEVVPIGESWSTALPAVEGQTQARCILSASFANGMMERKEVPLSWTVVPAPKPASESTDTPAAPDAPPPDAAPAGDRP